MAIKIKNKNKKRVSIIVLCEILHITDKNNTKHIAIFYE